MSNINVLSYLKSKPWFSIIGIISNLKTQRVLKTTFCIINILCSAPYFKVSRNILNSFLVNDTVLVHVIEISGNSPRNLTGIKVGKMSRRKSFKN
jgi:hypothetical protein